MNKILVRLLGVIGIILLGYHAYKTFTASPKLEQEPDQLSSDVPTENETATSKLASRPLAPGTFKKVATEARLLGEPRPSDLKMMKHYSFIDENNAHHYLIAIVNQVRGEMPGGIHVNVRTKANEKDGENYGYDLTPSDEVVFRSEVDTVHWQDIAASLEWFLNKRL